MKDSEILPGTQCSECFMLSTKGHTPKCNVLHGFYFQWGKKSCFAFCGTQEEHDRRIRDCQAYYNQITKPNKYNFEKRLEFIERKKKRGNSKMSMPQMQFA